MAPPNLPKNQHYVPQFLLKGFTFGKKGQVYVFDKQTGATFPSAVRNLAAERGFYNFEAEGAILSLEPALADLEEKSASLVKRIRREESIGWMGVEERALLSYFALIQMVRTKNYVERLLDMNRLVREHFAGDVLAPEFEAELSEFNEEDARRSAARLLLQAHDMVPLLLNKIWMLGTNKTPSPFYISDNPFAMHNRQDFGAYGSIGLGVPGIEIYLPISSTLTLNIVCPSFLEEAEQTIARVEGARLSSPVFAPLEGALEKARILRDAMRSAGTLTSSSENVRYHNWLQVRYAERFVFSEKNDFSLAREILAKNPEARTGPRIKLG